MTSQETSTTTVVGSNINEENFTPVGEKVKSHGNIYHCQQMMLFLCESVARSNVSFKVTCEVEEAGKFDDIVLFYECDGRQICRLIQIKHKINTSKPLTLNVLKTHKDFKLQTYFDSYVEINEKFEQKFGYKIDELILCTNIDFVRDLRNHMDIVPNSIFNKNNLYRVKSNPNFMNQLAVGNNNDVRIFFDKLRFAVKQSDGDDLIDYIKDEIDRYLEKEYPEEYYDPNRTEIIYVDLLTKIFHFNTNPKVQIVTNETYIKWIKEALNSGENMLSVYHRHNKCVSDTRRLQFECESLKKLETFIMLNETNLMNLIACADTIFSVQKLIQIFNRLNKHYRLIKDEQVDTSRRNIKQDYVSADQCEYLVVVCESKKFLKRVFETVKEIYNKISSDSNSNKHIILVSDLKVSETFPSYYDKFAKVEDRIKWDDFDEETKEYIRNKEIVFQGRQIRFSDIDISYACDSIKDRVLSDIILSDNYEIGKPFHDSKTDDMTYFIQRNIRLCDQISNPFNISESDQIFAISNINEGHFEKFMLSVSSENRKRYFRLDNMTAREHFQIISNNNSDKNVTWIHFENEKFYWKASSRSISIVKKHIDTDSSCEIKLNTFSDIDNKFVLIIGEPGMGKSTLLSSLATKSIKQSPHVWVIKIDLNNYTRYFSDLLESHETFPDEKSAIEFITNSQELCDFGKVLLRSYFQIENKLIVLLDGFDEIAPNYKHIVVELVKILKNVEKIKIWITSRPQEQVFLEEQLTVLSYSLSEFTNADQQQFFVRFLKTRVGELNLREDRLNMFVDRLLEAISKLPLVGNKPLTSIPLQCKMLAEVYNDDFIEFYKTDAADTRIPDVIDIFDLYSTFIRKKCIINIKEKKKIDTTISGNTTLVDDEIERLLSNYKLMCLGIIFGKEDEEKLLTEESREKIKKSTSNIENGIDKCGIVCSIDNENPVFLHRTFAEYFAAMYLKDFIRNAKNTEKNERIAFVKSKIFESEYTVVRHFFDRLTGTHNIFKYALNGRVKQVQKELENDRSVIDQTDEFGRNVLHLIAGYDYTEDICNYLVKFGADTTNVDKLFEFKPVEYAYTLKVWKNVNALIVGNENDTSILELIEDEEELMCIAGAEGWTRLVKYLIETGKIHMDTTNRKGYSTLHLAASQGQIETCQYLIKMGANIDYIRRKDYTFNIEYVSFMNETPLHVATRKGFIEIVKMIVEHDINLIKAIIFKETLLHKAMESGNIETLKLFIKNGANVKSINNKKETPLHIAKKDTGINIIALLLEHGANIDEKDKYGFSPIMKYVKVGNYSVVKYLLKKGADIYQCNRYDETVLHLAASYGNLEILKMFMAKDSHIIKKIGFRETLLHNAIRSNNTAIIELLIKHGANVNGRNEEDETPLYIALYDTSTDIVDMLLTHGANIEATDCDGNTPLIKYTENYNIPIVQLLVEKGANIHHRSKYGTTVLHHFAFGGSLKMVKMLIEHDPEIMSNVDFSETVLHAAMESNNIEIVGLLIEHGANVNGRNERDETPLHMALDDPSTKIIDMLLTHGANIEATDCDGNTPLIKYAENDNLPVVQLLVEKEANIFHRSKNGTNVLHLAASTGHLNIFKMLIEREPKIMSNVDFFETLLYAAMESNEISIVGLLIEYGANVNGRNDRGETPLHIAFHYTYTKIVDMLLTHGANIEATDCDGNTPLIKYAENDNLPVVQLLVEKGANIYHRSKNGTNVLHLAASTGHLKMVKMLIEREPKIMSNDDFFETILHAAMESNKIAIIGLLIEHRVNINGRNERGETPLHIAFHDTNIEIVDMLLTHGADIEATDCNGNTPLISYANEGNLPVVQLLLEKGANIHPSFEDSSTLLHFAASADHSIKVRKLSNRSIRNYGVFSEIYSDESI